MNLTPEMTQTLYVAPIALTILYCVARKVSNKVNQVYTDHAIDHEEFQGVKKDIKHMKVEGQNRKDENTLILEGINALCKRAIEQGANGTVSGIQKQIDEYLDEVIENRR